MTSLLSATRLNENPAGVSFAENLLMCISSLKLVSLLHFLSGEIDLFRRVEAEALVLRRQQIIVKHQEVCILADGDEAPAMLTDPSF